MVQIMSLLIATVFMSTGLTQVYAGKGVGFTIRDLVEHDLFSRDLDLGDLITREEVEQLFGRNFDSDWSSLTGRDLQDMHARDPVLFVAFFQTIGEFVKRTASDYWTYMVRKAHLALREVDDSELTSRVDSVFEDVTARNERVQLAERSTSWFGKALARYRDNTLEATLPSPPPPSDALERDLFDYDHWDRRFFDYESDFDDLD